MVMKKRRIVLPIILGVLASIVICGFAAKTLIENNLDQLAYLTVPDVDITKIEDGTYAGSYKEFPISAKVEVTVKDHQITAVELIEHKSGQGKPAEAITDKVIEAQSLDVDVISGATLSSKVILMAIENALSGAE
jgi:uncharacterized protein with FMN-binding domain